MTVSEFNFEERAAIYLYCLAKLPISEIVTATDLSTLHVISTLILYSEKLISKLSLFKEAVPYDANDLVPVREMLEFGEDS